MVPFLVPFWSNFGSQNGPQNCSKFGPKNANFGVHFWIPFFEAWVPLGSFLGLFEAVLGGLGPPKTLKNNWFFKVFANSGFRYFEALDGPLGLILPPSWADLVPKWPQNGPQSGPKSVQKMIQKITPTNTKRNNFGSQNGPQNGSRWREPSRGAACRSSLKSSCFQDGTKMAQDGPE